MIKESIKKFLEEKKEVSIVANKFSELFDSAVFEPST